MLHIRLRQFSKLMEKRLSLTRNREDETKVADSFSMVTGWVGGLAAEFPPISLIVS